MQHADLELSVRRRDNGYRADARFTSPNHDVLAAADVPIALDHAALRALNLDPAAYGRQLTASLFAEPQLRAAWQQARAVAQQLGALRLRVRLDAGAPDLHALRWELLRDPEDDTPLALSERVRLSRYLESRDFTPLAIPIRPELRALVIVANPTNLAAYKLAEVDVEGEVGRARTALGDIPTTIIGDHPDAQARRATLATIAAALRDAPHLVVLVCHGSVVDSTPYLWLEQEDGRAEQVLGSTFVQTIAQLTARPLLLILASCQSGGRGYDDALAALGPQLARAGVAGVLAFQGDVAMATVRRLLPPLFTELRRDGSIDRALAAARSVIANQPDWWLPVLTLRVPDGQLWHLHPPPAPPPASATLSAGVVLEPPEGTMRPDSPFYIARQPAERIALGAARSGSGVTLTIKGPRQVGKSSLLTRVMDAAAQTGKQVAYLDFQQFDEAARADAETFFAQFARWLSDELGLDGRLDDTTWPTMLGTVQRCTRYMERVILPTLGGQVLLAMDEVDSILDCPFRTDFFAMLRVWHNNRSMPNRPQWRRLDLALVTSTEPYELVQNLHQSPFNVGEVIELVDFDATQVATLNALHSGPLPPTEEAQLVGLLNGHPYLTRRALYLIADGRSTSTELFAQAASEDGPFGEHLRRHLQRLQERPELAQALRQVLRTQSSPDDRSFWRLRGAGLVRREGSRSFARCQLYADYFGERLR